jgi:hypothetical protein
MISSKSTWSKWHFGQVEHRLVQNGTLVKLNMGAKKNHGLVKLNMGAKKTMV